MDKVRDVVENPGKYRKLYAAGGTFLIVILNTFVGDSSVVDLVAAVLGALGVERLPND